MSILTSTHTGNEIRTKNTLIKIFGELSDVIFSAPAYLRKIDVMYIYDNCRYKIVLEVPLQADKKECLRLFLKEAEYHIQYMLKSQNITYDDIDFTGEWRYA